MTKRTPQEIADFFGCYVFEAETEGDFYVTKQKPIQDYDCYVMSVDDGALGILSEFVSFPADHDRTHLYEPQSGNQGKTEEDFPNHAKEVYTHKEYRIVSAVADTEDLDSKVTKLLNEGWKPIGGVAFSQYDDNHYETFYQAMVRGV